MDGNRNDDRKSSFKPPEQKLRDSPSGCLLQAIGLAAALIIGIFSVGVFLGFRDSVCCYNLAWPTLIVGGGASLAILVTIGYWIRR